MLNDQNKEDPRLISYQALRKAVGWLGISLPPALPVGSYIFSNCTYLQDAISHYYYTITGNLLVGILCAVALFLIAYKGYDKRDDRWTSGAGVAALFIAFFPANDSSKDSCAIFHLTDNSLRNTIHFVSAAIFFMLLACISIFLFTKSKGIKTKQKIMRNKIYRVCGVVIFVSILLVGVYEFFGTGVTWLSKIKPKFWLESVAMSAFGISWLVKGELILKDKDSLQ
jgi:hypothetical protein